MKICVVGAGAIGGFLAVKLALAGEQVTVIARGAHLAAIQQNGLKLQQDGTESVAKAIAATNSIAEAGIQDVVILGLKAHQIEAIAADLPALFDPGTIVVPVQNGIPWWYFQKLGGKFEGRTVKSVDPHGTIARYIEPERIIGCISYPATEIAEPGLIRHIEGDRFPVGELDGSESARVRSISDLFTKAGFKAPILTDIRAEIWLKLWGNLTFNPISALTHATLVDICQYPLTRELAAAMMSEAQTVANKLGVTFRVSLEKRIAGAESVGKHKTSMLQDTEAGKALEIDAMLGAVVELAEVTDTQTPHLKALHACTKLLDRIITEERVGIIARPL